MEEILNFFKTVDFIREFNNLNKRIETIESWRNSTADPKLAENITNIQNIFSKMNNEIVPSINKAASLAQTASQTAQEASSKAINALDQSISSANLAQTASNLAQQAQQQAQAILTQAETAASQANSALEQVLVLQERFTFAAENIEKDIDNVRVKAENFVTVLIRETTAIAEQFKVFGDTMYEKTLPIQQSAQAVSDEINEMLSEMGPPLHHAEVYINATANEGLGLALYNTLMVVACLVSREMIDTINYGAFGAKRAWLDRYKNTANGSVLEELFEGFGEITNNFVQFGQKVLDLGNDVQGVTGELQERISISTTLIDIAFKEFTDAFYSIFFNLSFTLKGEIPPTSQ